MTCNFSAASLAADNLSAADYAATYSLPELDYDYGALEPHISGQIMQLHHDRHHKAYVDGANKALEQLAQAREKNDFEVVPKLEKDLAFNLSGHINHSIFWKNMTPDGGDEPQGELADFFCRFFGSFAAFKAHFSAAALTIQGSGWAQLAWNRLGGIPVIQQVYDQQNNSCFSSTPLLVLDMWEHAFYLDYKNVKGEYVNAFWKLVNWNDVLHRLARASHIHTAPAHSHAQDS